MVSPQIMRADFLLSQQGVNVLDQARKERAKFLSRQVASGVEFAQSAMRLRDDESRARMTAFAGTIYDCTMSLMTDADDLSPDDEKAILERLAALREALAALGAR